MRAVEMMASREAWSDALLSPYLERRLEELADTGAPVRVALERGLCEERPASSDTVIQQALGKAARIWRRPDGKPVFLGEEDISVAHASDFTLAVACADGAACDLEVDSCAPRTPCGAIFWAGKNSSSRSGLRGSRWAWRGLRRGCGRRWSA